MSNKEGYKKTDLGDLPFDWNTKRIEDICEILDSKRVPLNKEQRDNMKGSIPYYGANGIVDYINDYLFDEDLILMAEDGGYFDEYRTRHIAYKVKGKSWVNNHAHVLKVLDSQTYEFIYYTLVHKNILPFINGGTRAKLNQADLKKILIQYPPLREQQKIAEILSSVDAAIEKTEQVIAKTEEVKKGLMQQLLTKGIGHTEFKQTEIGEIPVEWKVVKLGDVFKVKSGEGLPAKSIKHGHYPVYGGNGISNYHAQYMFKDSKLVIGRVGEKCGCVHLTQPYSWITDNALYVENMLEAYENKYMFYLLSYINLNSYANKNAQPVISGKILYAIKIALPSLEEQKKIINYLEKIDEKDTIELEKLEKLKNIKQGLMQQLLTGETRVKVD